VTVRLSRKQAALRKEIEDISAAILMDHWNISQYHAESRTTRLELIKRSLIHGNIVQKYTYVDECLAVIACNHFFQRHVGEKTFSRLWKTEKFRAFNHYIMDDTYLLGKLRLVRALGEVPKAFRDYIEQLNALRNAIAHSFFPENRRDYFGKGGLSYKGSNIYTLDGVRKLDEDFQQVRKYLAERAGEDLP